MNSVGSLFSIVRIAGQDAKSFLQGQMTQDMHKYENLGDIYVSAYCSVQGKVLALGFLLYKTLDEFYFIIPQTIAQQTAKRLKMFTLHQQVTVEILDHQCLFYSSPPDDRQSWVCLYDNLYLGFEESSIAGALSDEQTLMILLMHYFPYLSQVLVDQFVPQMLNLEKINGIARGKGCYVGQEVIARTWYKGAVKRRSQILQVINYTGKNHYQAGENLFVDDRQVATVIQSSASDNQCYILAVVQDRYINEILSAKENKEQLKVIEKVSE